MKENDRQAPLFPSIWWRDAISKVIFLYVVFQFLRQLYSIYAAYTTVRNPLIPDYLANYVAFPHYFLACYWGAAMLLYYKYMKDEKWQKRHFLLLPISLILFLVVAFLLYLLLMELNPFG